MAAADATGSAIFDATYGGDLERVRALLAGDWELARAKATIGGTYEPGTTPLKLAAYAGQEAIAEILLAAGSPIDDADGDGTALMLAVWSGHAAVAELLLAHGADVRAATASGETALHFAAYRGDVGLGRRLLAAGADPGRPTGVGPSNIFATSPPVIGETPMHLAAAYGHAALVALLLEHGASPSAADRAGQLPLHWAARHQQDGTTALLRARTPG